MEEPLQNHFDATAAEEVAGDLFPLPLFPAEPGCSPLCTGTAWDLSLDGIW